jgi:hypothetical protein
VENEFSSLKLLHATGLLPQNESVAAKIPGNAKRHKDMPNKIKQ